MSLSSTNNRVDYIGNGAVDTYAYTFRIFVNTDLEVTVRNTSDTESTLVLTTDYTVTGVGADGGGNVALVNSSQAWLDSDGDLKTDYVLTIRRVRPITQTTDIRNQGTFFPETHEDAYDHGIMVSQQIQEQFDRTVTLPVTIASSEFDPSLPTNIGTANKVLITNAGGTGFSLASQASFGLDLDATRVFKTDTYANLKVLAAADPTSQRWGWASDISQLVFYCADTSKGDQGWILVSGG